MGESTHSVHSVEEKAASLESLTEDTLKQRKKSRKPDVELPSTRSHENKENIVSTLRNLAYLQDSGTFFVDGKRKIDFVLVYTVSERDKLEDKHKHARWRRKYITNLQKVGLQFEKDRVVYPEYTLYFLKVHVPFDVVTLHAEKLLLKAPVKSVPIHEYLITSYGLDCLNNLMKQDVPNMPDSYYSAPFKRSMMHRYIGIQDQTTFFSNKDRQKIAYDILVSTLYGPIEHAEIGIESLLYHGAMTAAFPLHDGPYEIPEDAGDPSSFNQRQVLCRYWSSWRCWYKEQPLELIRQYFGEKVAYYFAMLGFYATWLLVPTILGVVVFLIAAFNAYGSRVVEEVCDSGTNFKMCPMCDEQEGCPYFYLSNLCVHHIVSFLFDTPATVVFAFFMSLWNMLFWRYWGRYATSLAYQWGTLDYERQHERPSAFYLSNCDKVNTNPATGETEPYFSKSKRMFRQRLSFLVLVLMILVVVITVICMVFMRMALITRLYTKFANTPVSLYAPLIANLLSAVAYLVFILIFELIWRKLAYVLTKWEVHRTLSEFDDSYAIKMFIFNFIDEFGLVIYVAFIKGRFVGYPGQYNHILGYQLEQCFADSCISELGLHIALMMILRQSLFSIGSYALPKVKKHLNYLFQGLNQLGHLSLVEENFYLEESPVLYSEFAWIIIQFSYMTLFIAAFPLAPLFALINTYFELRSDATKFVMTSRRPIATRAKDIGIYQDILIGISHLSVIVNAFLIAFTSQFVPRLLYQIRFSSSLEGYTNFTFSISPNGTMKEACYYRGFRDEEGNLTQFHWELLVVRLSFVVLYEHTVLLFNSLVMFLIEAVPPKLKIKLARENFLARQTLADIDMLKAMLHFTGDSDITLVGEAEEASSSSV